MSLPGVTEIKHHSNERIYSPLHGKIKALNEMDDSVFANGSLGKGICVMPDEGKIVSPCDGILTALFPTGHAYGIRSSRGTEVLIHIGSDTYNIENGFFQTYKNQGDCIKQGELLAVFDLEALVSHGYNIETAVLISNSSDYLDVIPICDDSVDYNENLLAVIKSERVKKISEGRSENETR